MASCATRWTVATPDDAPRATAICVIGDKRMLITFDGESARFLRPQPPPGELRLDRVEHLEHVDTMACTERLVRRVTSLKGHAVQSERVLWQ